MGASVTERPVAVSVSLLYPTSTDMLPESPGAIMQRSLVSPRKTAETAGPPPKRHA